MSLTRIQNLKLIRPTTVGISGPKYNPLLCDNGNPRTFVHLLSGIGGRLSLFDLFNRFKEYEHYIKRRLYSIVN